MSINSLLSEAFKTASSKKPKSRPELSDEETAMVRAVSAPVLNDRAALYSVSVDDESDNVGEADMVADSQEDLDGAWDGAGGYKYIIRKDGALEILKAPPGKYTGVIKAGSAAHKAIMDEKNGRKPAADPAKDDPAKETVKEEPVKNLPMPENVISEIAKMATELKAADPLTQEVIRKNMQVLLQQNSQSER